MVRGRCRARHRRRRGRRVRPAPGCDVGAVLRLRQAHVDTLFPHRAAKTAADPDHPSISLIKAFLVEDSPVIRDNLISALEELVPLSVVGWADDEAGALRWLGDPANVCDLAILDIFLRAGSGTGILRALRAAGSPLQRVVLTNYASPDLARQCLELGAERVFDKSRDIDALINYCAALKPRG